MLTRDGVKILGWDSFHCEVLLDNLRVVSERGKEPLPKQFVSAWVLGMRIRLGVAEYQLCEEIRHHA